MYFSSSMPLSLSAYISLFGPSVCCSFLPKLRDGFGLGLMAVEGSVGFSRERPSTYGISSGSGGFMK